jgi:hypothetical protein
VDEKVKRSEGRVRMRVERRRKEVTCQDRQIVEKVRLDECERRTT